MLISGHLRLRVRVWWCLAERDSRVRVPVAPLAACCWRRARPWKRSSRPLSKGVRVKGGRGQAPT